MWSLQASAREPRRKQTTRKTNSESHLESLKAEAPPHSERFPGGRRGLPATLGEGCRRSEGAGRKEQRLAPGRLPRRGGQTRRIASFSGLGLPPLSSPPPTVASKVTPPPRFLFTCPPFDIHPLGDREVEEPLPPPSGGSRRSFASGVISGGGERSGGRMRVRAWTRGPAKGICLTTVPLASSWSRLANVPAGDEVNPSSPHSFTRSSLFHHLFHNWGVFTLSVMHADGDPDPRGASHPRALSPPWARAAGRGQTGKSSTRAPRRPAQGH